MRKNAKKNNFFWNKYGFRWRCPPGAKLITPPNISHGYPVKALFTRGSPCRGRTCRRLKTSISTTSTGAAERLKPNSKLDWRFERGFSSTRAVEDGGRRETRHFDLQNANNKGMKLLLGFDKDKGRAGWGMLYLPFWNLRVE